MTKPVSPSAFTPPPSTSPLYDPQPSNPLSDTQDKKTSGISVHALIVAAGRGQRFGSHIAKQYTQVAGQSILQHSVAHLALSPYINEVHIVVAADDKYIHKLNFTVPVHLAIGGAARWQSVQAGVDAIAKAGASPDDLVLIHDAARPCIKGEHINKVIKVAMQERYGAILGTPVADTLKQVTATEMQSVPQHTVVNNQNDNSVLCLLEPQSVNKEHDIRQITQTIDRSHLWQAQTPQVFRLAKLMEVLNYVNDNDLDITDEASAFEFLQYPVKIVEGDRTNIKLTYPTDLPLLTAMLKISK